MNPTDSTCIHSTLMFINDHAWRHGVTSIPTFNQPLWWKALIVEAEPERSDLRRIVLGLGSFHNEMNFMGCTGHLMDSSELQEMLESIYAPNAVVHMLSCNATAWAVRAHFIVDAALNALILRRVLHAPLPYHSETPESNDYDPDIAGTADVGSATIQVLIPMTSFFILSQRKM